MSGIQNVESNVLHENEDIPLAQTAAYGTRNTKVMGSIPKQAWIDKLYVANAKCINSNNLKFKESPISAISNYCILHF